METKARNDISLKILGVLTILHVVASRQSNF